MLSLAFYGFLYYTLPDMFQQFNKQNMPEPQRLVIIKRTTANPMYIGYRTDKNFDATESNKNTSWFGSKITDLGKCAFGQHNFGYAFNDATVTEWCYLEDFVKSNITE